MFQRIFPGHASFQIVLAVGLTLLLGGVSLAQPVTMQALLRTTTAKDWRPLDPSRTLIMQLPQGRVVIELAPAFAPQHVANIETLAQAHYFDGLSINRVQDNFVVQWGDPHADQPKQARILPDHLHRPLPAEYSRTARGLPFTALVDPDSYAARTGFSMGLPVARNTADTRTWLVHCYGMVGVGRDNPPDTGNGSELYVVIGQAPRQLDRNITLVGRVVEGMPLLAALPRGHGPMGFYRHATQRTPILSLRLAATLAPPQRPHLQVLRTETSAFRHLIAIRRHRSDTWYVRPANRINVCNVPLPVRDNTPKPGHP